MFCSKCGKKVNENANFCSNCGHGVKDAPTNTGPKSKPTDTNINPSAGYSDYLKIGGWVFIIFGILSALRFFSLAGGSYNPLSNYFIAGGFISLIFISTSALLYFALHTAILKIIRIEQTLGIENQNIPPQPTPTTPEQKNASDPTDDDLPWELREDK